MLRIIAIGFSLAVLVIGILTRFNPESMEINTENIVERVEDITTGLLISIGFIGLLLSLSIKNNR